MILAELIYVVVAVMLAAIHAELIKRGKVSDKILHLVNGFLHVSMAVAVGWLFWWPGAICILCNTRPVFDGCLNKFRGLAINYIPEKPTSIIDQAELKVFGRDFYTPRIIYLCISVVLNAVYLIFIK